MITRKEYWLIKPKNVKKRLMGGYEYDELKINVIKFKIFGFITLYTKNTVKEAKRKEDIFKPNTRKLK